MRKLNFKSHLINTLPNIQGLDELRQKLKTHDFVEQNSVYSKTIELSDDLPIHKLTQQIALKEPINPMQVKERIAKSNLEGYLIPTFLLEESLKYNPLPLSAQKQDLITRICQMNNGKHNEAEGINIIYARHQEADPIFHNKIDSSLSANLPSQVVSVIHNHSSSRLTIGEAKSIYSLPQPYPYGEAILQIGHLKYHALDLDLSQQIRPEAPAKTKRITGDVSVFETCISIPFDLKNNNFSDHGFILYLKGNQITPKLISEIIGLTRTGFGGVIIANGILNGSILSRKPKTIFKKSETFKHRIIKKQKESIGSFTYEPSLDLTKNGYATLEHLGELSQVDGEIILAFYPLHQTFIGEYK